MGCVVYGIQLGFRGVVVGLVCSTSSGFSSGPCSQCGFLASGFHCACVRVRAWLGAFVISTDEKKYF